MRCACTMDSQGDHSNTVNRPSCDATSAAQLVLILHKLRGRKMPGAAELVGVNQRGLAAFDGLRHDDLFHLRMTFAPGNLRAKTEHVVLHR